VVKAIIKVEQKEYPFNVKDDIVRQERRKRILHVLLNEKFLRTINKKILKLGIVKKLERD
jgi:hypothetical protein